jgi:hypothetical protein
MIDELEITAKDPTRRSGNQYETKRTDRLSVCIRFSSYRRTPVSIRAFVPVWQYPANLDSGFRRKDGRVITGPSQASQKIRASCESSQL